MAPDSLSLDVWSDVACPWCWVGKRHLEAAAETLSRERGIDLNVTWRAFELDPSAPASYEGTVDYVGRLATKYGTDRPGAQAMIDRMVQVGAANGLEFRFDRVQPGNTFDAHRLLCWAHDNGDQDALKERLFAAYMTEGRSVADHQVLVDCANDVGLDAEAAGAMLASEEYATNVRAEQRQAFQIGVRGVPFFVIANRYAISGAQPSEVILGALERAATEAVEIVAGSDAPACGPDGC